MVPILKIIIDGNYILHKNFHVFKNFHTDKVFTGTTFGFCRELLTLKKTYKTSCFEVTWDSATNRKQLNTDYKSNRALPEFNPYTDIKVVHSMLHALGIPQWKTEGAESDDLLYSLTRDLNEDVLLYSRDADILGCLSPHVSVLLGKKIINLSNFGEFYPFEFSESRWNRYKALLGDRSDNVKGVGLSKKKILNLLDAPLSREHQVILEQNSAVLNLRKVTPNLMYANPKHDSDAVYHLLERLRIKSLSALHNL